MRTEFFTIAGGNKTALIWECESSMQKQVVEETLTSSEQVGFITETMPPTRPARNEGCWIGSRL